jgi:hypothetical protein
LSASALSHHGRSLAAFTTNIAESDFRYTQQALAAATTDDGVKLATEVALDAVAVYAKVMATYGVKLTIVS